jgi:hypothetical protein
MACADVVRAKAKAETAINRTIGWLFCFSFKKSIMRCGSQQDLEDRHGARGGDAP